MNAATSTTRLGKPPFELYFLVNMSKPKSVLFREQPVNVLYLTNVEFGAPLILLSSLLMSKSIKRALTSTLRLESADDR